MVLVVCDGGPLLRVLFGPKLLDKVPGRRSSGGGGGRRSENRLLGGGGGVSAGAQRSVGKVSGHGSSGRGVCRLFGGLSHAYGGGGENQKKENNIKKTR